MNKSCFISQTITSGMAENTKDDIVEMSRWLLSVLKTTNLECINLDNQKLSLNHFAAQECVTVWPMFKIFCLYCLTMPTTQAYCKTSLYIYFLRVQRCQGTLYVLCLVLKHTYTILQKVKTVSVYSYHTMSWLEFLLGNTCRIQMPSSYVFKVRMKL